MTRRPCPRCLNGWLMHPTGDWGVSCPVCQPNDQRYWLADGTTYGTVVGRQHLPPGHPSQDQVPMPDHVRQAVTEAAAAARQKAAALTGHTPSEAS